MRKPGLDELAYQIAQLSAPQEDGQAVILPPICRWRAVYEANRTAQHQRGCSLQGRSFAALATEARRDMLQRAWRHTSRYRDLPRLPDDAEQPVPTLISGHQPQLFHPGVWAKNIAVALAARAWGAIAINLIIDNDVAGTASLRVPTGSVSDPRRRTVVMDAQRVQLPIEERKIEDRQSFASFGRRVRDLVEPLVPNPLIQRFWPLAQAAAEQNDHLGMCLAQARHQYERDLGLRSLEAPLSQICNGTPFQWFVAHVLAQLPRFQIIYNDSLAEYRRLHRVRSRSHPAPDLASEGDWREAPFWIWTTERPLRRRLFVRQRGPELELSDREQMRLSLPLRPEGSAEAALEAWRGASFEGVKIRPRALMTTMYARLFLGDLFVHGIGGAKYDRLTDELIRGFFGVEPPVYATVSATCLLPVPRTAYSIDDLRAVDRLLRDVEYHPERLFGAEQRGESVRQLILAKEKWIGDTREDNGRQRHEQITKINAKLNRFLESKRRQWLVQRGQLVDALRKKAVLSSREYSFCLFPHETLFPLLLELFATEP